MLLKVKDPNARGLKPATNAGEESSTRSGAGQYNQKNQPIRTLANSLEGYFQKIPVIDRTGLPGRFDMDLAWDKVDWQHHNVEALKQALFDQLGLELVPSLEPIEMLAVENLK